MKPIIAVVQGPNLNLLGEREPEIYGVKTLQELETELNEYASSFEYELEHYQSNHEGSLIDYLQSIRHRVKGILINAGAYSHTSIGLADVIQSLQIPVVEIHLSDTRKREFFRFNSFLTSVVVATFQGEGFVSYRKGLEYLVQFIEKKLPKPKFLTKTFSVEEKIWLDDTDAAGIMFNGHLFRICHRVYEKWLFDLGFPIKDMLSTKQWGLLIARVEGVFHRPLPTGLSIRITLQIEKISERSFTLVYRIWDTQSNLYASASSTHVSVDGFGKKTDFSEDFKIALLKFLDS